MDINHNIPSLPVVGQGEGGLVTPSPALSLRPSSPPPVREGPPAQPPKRKSRRNQPSFLRELLGLGVKIALIVAAAVAIFTLVYGLHYNADPAMVPALKDGDLVMYYRWDKSYAPGDLILLTYRGQTQVRRVVAVAGDTVNINELGLIVNGSPQSESEIYARTERYDSGINFPLTLRAGEVFVLGDARDVASDSRIYGAVKVKDTKGTVITLLRRRSL